MSLVIHGLNEHGEVVFAVGDPARTSQISATDLRLARDRAAHAGGTLEVNRVKLDESDLNRLVAWLDGSAA